MVLSTNGALGARCGAPWRRLDMPEGPKMAVGTGVGATFGRIVERHLLQICFGSRGW